MGKIEHKEKPLEQRLKESTNILTKYPDRVCIYVEKLKNCEKLPILERSKYLVPKTITAAQFIYVIRTKLQLSKDIALFFYIKNSILSGDILIGELYNKHSSDDGFLYIKYTAESCFG